MTRNTIQYNTISLRSLWFDYRSELLFLILLSACTVLCHWLSRFIPLDIFDAYITAIQNAGNAMVCLFCAWLMFRHSEGLRIRKAWGFTLLGWGIADCFYLTQTYFMNQPVLNIGSESLDTYKLLAANLLGWLLLLYPTESLRPGWLTCKHIMLQLLPMVALVVLDYLVPWDLRIIICIYPGFLFGLVLVHLRAYRLWCEDNYASMERIDVQWIVRYLLILLVIGCSFLYMSLTNIPTRAFTQQLLLFFIFAYGTEQILFRKDPWENVQRENAQEMPEDAPAPKGVLEQWMENEKPYLNPDFQLKDLRAVLPMNRTYLSKYIHDMYDCSFYQYVTSYRIEEAKRLMSNHPDMTIADVATRSGFSSRIVFTRVFTKEMGVSPREWSLQSNNS